MNGKLQISRRNFLAYGAGGAALLTGLGVQRVHAAQPHAHLIAGKIDHEIVAGHVTKGLMSFAPDGPPPLLRMKQGQQVTIDVENKLEEATTVHWHGLRIPNNQDGVPYLTQWPIMWGEKQRYQFTPPDAGTFWYHPHCNTLEQMGKGMTGVMIVDEAEDPGFDQDLALNLRDFRIGPDGAFVNQFKKRQAARGGTLGLVKTVNWQVKPVYDLPAGSLVRLRLVATDVTRTYQLSLPNAIQKLIAMDSNPTPENYQPEMLQLGAGQRADIALRVPDQEGEVINLIHQSGSGKTVLAQFRAVGQSVNRHLSELKPLPANPVVEPDLANAEVMPFVFGWAPGDPPKQSVCGTLGYTFWSINRIAWEGDTPEDPGALATLKLGKSYVFRLRNETVYTHPIHLHGMTFKLLSSNKRDLPPLWTDTALLQAGETMDIAFVADNPGKWVFHCHVIEHQKTGLTGYIEVV